MRKILVLFIGALLIGTAASAKEYAIIKDTMFGGQKIEVYRSLKDALENYSGQGKLYEITLKPVRLKRVESKKTVEVSEFKWAVDERVENTQKEQAPVPKEEKAMKAPALKKESVLKTPSD